MGLQLVAGGPEVDGVDFEVREVRSNKGNFRYDYLILTPGSRPSFLNTKVTEIHPDTLVFSDVRTIPACTIVWAAGVEPGPLVESLDVPKDARGHILVEEFLHVKDRPGVYALGGCISIEGRPRLPTLAPQSAEQEGETAGRSLAAEILGKKELVPFSYD